MDSERQVVASRRKDEVGIAADMVERREDASSGRGVSARDTSFNRFRLRREGSTVPFKVSNWDWLCERGAGIPSLPTIGSLALDASYARIGALA